MQTEQIRIRLTPDETAKLRKLAGRFGLQASSLALLYVRAGMAASAAFGDRLPLPLELEIKEPYIPEPTNRLNEKPPPKRK